MKLTYLKYALMLAKAQHFGKASELCNVTQPALSVGIKKLEETLGIVLFERGKAHVQVTSAGKPVLQQFQRVFDEIDKIYDLASHSKGHLTTPLSLGVLYTVGQYLFPHLIRRMQGLAPDMSLCVKENFTEKLRESLCSGEIDAAIVAQPFIAPDILTRNLYDEALMVLMPKGHPWAKLEAIDKKQLSRTPLLLLGEGHCFRDQVLELQNHNTDQLDIVAEGNSLESIRAMVASGLGISVLPMSSVTLPYNSDLVIAKPFKPPIPMRTIAIAWRTSFPRYQAIDVLIKAINLCNTLEIKPLPSAKHAHS